MLYCKHMNNLSFKTQMDNIKRVNKSIKDFQSWMKEMSKPFNEFAVFTEPSKEEQDKAFEEMECWSVDNHLKTCKNHFRDDTKLIKEVEQLLNWGVKNGFLDDSCKDWSWEKKLEFYRSCP